MTCEACAMAAAEPSGLFHASCRQCQARMLSRSPEFFESMKAGGPTEAYRTACKRMGLKHADVVAAHEVDAMGKTAREAA